MPELPPTRAVLFPDDPDLPVAVVTVPPEWGAESALVGGQPEYVTLHGGVASLAVHAYGKGTPGQRPNPRATRFPGRLIPGWSRSDTVVGPAVLRGWDLDEDRPADVSPEDERAAFDV